MDGGESKPIQLGTVAGQVKHLLLRMTACPFASNGSHEVRWSAHLVRTAMLPLQNLPFVGSGKQHSSILTPTPKWWVNALVSTSFLLLLVRHLLLVAWHLFLLASCYCFCVRLRESSGISRSVLLLAVAQWPSDPSDQPTLEGQ